MTSPRSMFTEAIEDHLALKKQNAALNDAMPAGSFAVGDPLDRYPGGPVKPALGSDLADDVAASTGSADGESTTAGGAGMPTSTTTALAAAAAAMAGSADGGQVLEGEFRRPLEPLNGMTPMLSLVEDIEDDESPAMTAALALASSEAASVLRFPGGVGPRPQHDAAQAASAVADAETTGEQPVIVIDADEPLAPVGMPAARAPRRLDSRTGVRRPTFFGLRRKRKDGDEPQGSGWFADDSPKDFNWDD